MSEGNHYGVPAAILHELEQTCFRPCIVHNNGLDELMIVEKDCSYIQIREPGSNISVLQGNHGDLAGKIVGVIIHGFTHWLK